MTPDHLLERLRFHSEEKANTAFARSTMREALQYLTASLDPDHYIGMEVSVDVSTGSDNDVDHRYFGKVTDLVESDGTKNGFVLLVQEPEANFKAAQPDAEDTYVDEHGAVWTRPSAWAYARVVKALNQAKLQQNSARLNECAATGEDCHYGPNGPGGEKQCKYCGEQP